MNNHRPLHIYMMCGGRFYVEKNQRSCDNNMYYASYGTCVPCHTFNSTVLCRHGGVDTVCTCNGNQYSGGACVRILTQMLLSPQAVYQSDSRSLLDNVCDSHSGNRYRRIQKYIRAFDNIPSGNVFSACFSLKKGLFILIML